MARSVTRELGGRGITANVVAPGFIDTDMTAALPEDRKDAYVEAIPAGRFAQPTRSPPLCGSSPPTPPPTSAAPCCPVDGGLGMGH